MNGTPWSEQEKNLIINNYPNLNCRQLMQLLPNRNYTMIRNTVSQLNLAQRKLKLNNLSKLNIDTYESYYWLGLLMADGYFSKTRLGLTLHNNDIEHLIKFNKYIESTNKIQKRKTDNCCTTQAMSKIDVENIRNKFKIIGQKTYNPIDLSYFDNKNPEYFLSFICGFIDGDGCIQIKYGKKDTAKGSLRLTIIGNQSWKNNFIKMFKFLHVYFNEPITSKLPKIRHQKGTQPIDRFDTSIRSEQKIYHFATFDLGRRSILESLKQEIIRLNLPFLTRKWDKIVIN